MTQWVENPTGGRDRGPAALARAWLEVLTGPRRFFERGIAPGDQAPGLVFAMTVVLLEEATRFALVPGAAPSVGGRPALAALFGLALATVFVAPAVLHLTAALQTVLLMALVRDRAGTSETVQVIAYATAPCVLAGIPSPTLRGACALYGAVLFFVGLRTVHETSTLRALVAGAIPAAIVFGYAFRGFAAANELVVWNASEVCFRVVELGAEVCVAV
ncbi:YIP1 family protein [Halorussus gelatinilyticus]|uniref:YIP1 family protein n=1 Tax=Halorussus gelatinilyticus TaxID=2937524 RepID=A0A8U0IIX6_9EURY|nr:YIP1 family protein [Halorussus gelatinilyticus]UPW00646.1 YIP1 family protein [Halorussus gelatinilyticus]